MTRMLVCGNVNDQSRLMTIGIRLGGKENRCIGVFIAIEWVTGNISSKETIVECGDVKEKIFTPSLASLLNLKL
jgi:hypothetical protein